MRWASLARDMAPDTSAGPATSTCPTTSPVAGFRTSITTPFSSVNYNPPMDKEELQRQLEDMEEASEQWRSEKRRLSSEIDKLEAALADAKANAARKRGGPSAGKP